VAPDLLLLHSVLLGIFPNGIETLLAALLCQSEFLELRRARGAKSGIHVIIG
jgi:hypothetical protein